MNTIKITRYPSPAGEMIVGSCGDEIYLCDWASGHRRDTNDRRIRRHLSATCEEDTSPAIVRAIAQLDEYFAGHRRMFDLKIRFTGSPFQCSVWSELQKIPYGTTISYAELARCIGNPKATRAVASAIAANPISIIVPCHRVIGSDRHLTGYAGGLDTKKYLLTLEGCPPACRNCCDRRCPDAHMRRFPRRNTPPIRPPVSPLFDCPKELLLSDRIK